MSDPSSPPLRQPPTPSLLFPPNPSLSPICPPGSILLNRYDHPNGAATAPLEKPGLLSTIKDAFVWKDPAGGTGPPPSAASLNRAAANSTAASRARSTSISAAGPSRHRSPSPSIRFAPLPDTGLKRNKSITMGVAARSAMLKTQGSAAAGAGGGGGKAGGRYVMMTDEEWEEYQKQFTAPPPPDLHLLVAAGTKKLWRKARSLSSSSSSTTSTSTSTSGVFPTDSETPRSRSSLSAQGRPVIPHGSALADELGPDLGGEEGERRDSMASVSSDFGSIQEEPEEEDEEGEAGAGEEDGMDVDNSDTESIDRSPLPEYLKSDMAAERHHFEHEMEVHHGFGVAAGAPAPLDHEHLTRHLRLLDLEGGGRRRREVVGEGGEEGEETPRGARTPSYRVGMEGLMSGHAQAQG